MTVDRLGNKDQNLFKLKKLLGLNVTVVKFKMTIEVVAIDSDSFKYDNWHLSGQVIKIKIN